jgi:hypothetical protein
MQATNQPINLPNLLCQSLFCQPVIQLITGTLLAERMYGTWQDYIANEEAANLGADRIVCLFERALVQLNLHPSLWQQYITALVRISPPPRLSNILRNSNNILLFSETVFVTF